MSNSSEETPSSFTLRILAGEARSYPGGSSTPKKEWSFLVTATSEPITLEVIKPWFKQSIVPLIGEQAAADLMRLLDTKEGEGFFNEVLAFRKSLE